MFHVELVKGTFSRVDTIVTLTKYISSNAVIIISREFAQQTPW